MRIRISLIFLVILVSIILGVIIFLGVFNISKKHPANLNLSTPQPSTTPTSIPTPTPIQKPIIDQNTNLEGELQKLTPADYSEDFKTLQDSF